MKNPIQRRERTKNILFQNGCFSGNSYGPFFRLRLDRYSRIIFQLVHFFSLSVLTLRSCAAELSGHVDPTANHYLSLTTRAVPRSTGWGQKRILVVYSVKINRNFKTSKSEDVLVSSDFGPHEHVYGLLIKYRFIILLQ